jgi:hypothetical protein
MYGLQIGTLELLLNDEVVWSLSDRQENEWKLAKISLIPGDYNVKFYKN